MRGLAEAQQVTAEVEEQQSPRNKLLAMIGGGKQDVATLKQELTAHQEEIAKLKAQLQKLQSPKEGVPPV